MQYSTLRSAVSTVAAIERSSMPHAISRRAFALTVAAAAALPALSFGQVRIPVIVTGDSGST
jgi:hypothetical protein